MMRNRDDFSRVPLFFRLWFAFVGLLAVAIIGTAIWAVVSLSSDPSQIGRLAGEVVKGYQETAG
jgi:hypothetical protein